MLTKFPGKFSWIFLLDFMCIYCISSLSEPGWIINGDLHYFYSDSGGMEQQNHIMSRQTCLELGADLLSIAGQTESDFVTKDISTGYWFGLYTDHPCDDCATDSNSTECESCRNGWMWLDGTPYTFQNWESHEPNHNEECSRLFKTGEWRDHGCIDTRYHFICKRKSFCLPSPCIHGECVLLYTKDKYNCSCDEGYTGRNCTEEVDECASSPCINNGLCSNGIGYYNCVCPDGWIGTNCELDFNECNESHVVEYCIHGSCTNNDGGYKCNCFEGYHGDKCQHITNVSSAVVISLIVCLLLLVLTNTGFAVFTYTRGKRLRFLERELEALKVSKNKTKMYYNVAADDVQERPGCDSTRSATTSIGAGPHTAGENVYQQISDYEKLKLDAIEKKNNHRNVYATIAKE